MKVVKMDSIAIPCTDLNSAKKIWDELASDQNIKDTVFVIHANANIEPANIR